jgi:hypothetical protein
MRILPPSLAAFLHFSILNAQTTTGPSASVSITAYTSYGIALDCVTKCVWGALRPGLIYSSDLPAALGCGTQWAYNGCFCRADLSNAADSFLGSCVASRCATATAVPGGVQGQVSSAQGFYNGYCGEVRAKEVPATATSALAGTGRGTGSTKAAATATATGGTVAATATQGSASTGESSAAASAASGSSSGLGKSDVIALGIGLGLGIPTLLLGLATFWVQIRKRKNARAESVASYIPERREAY